MSLLSKLSVRAGFTWMIGILAGGMLVFAVMAWLTLQQLQVNGPLYQRIVQGKDLIADILPPPEYVIESYLVVLQLADAPANQHPGLIDRLRKLREEFEQRHQFWLQEKLEPELQTRFLDQSYQEARRFYVVAFDEFLPAVQAGDNATAHAKLASMNVHYDAHRQHIDAVVAYATQRNTNDEAAARALIGWVRVVWIMLFTFSLGGGVLLAWLIARQLWARLGGEPSQAAELAERIAAGDLSGNVAVAPGDTQSIMASLRKTCANRYARFSIRP